MGRHREETGSEVADRLLEDWDMIRYRFVKVMPRDYKRVLEQRRDEVSAG